MPSTTPGRVRAAGGGRKRTVDTDETLLHELEQLVEPVTRGDPESALRWSCKCLRQLAEELTRQGHKTSHRMVGELLHALDYSLQANAKTLEGGSHPDRNAQFEHIHQVVSARLNAFQPVISVDTKKSNTLAI